MIDRRAPALGACVGILNPRRAAAHTVGVSIDEIRDTLRRFIDVEKLATDMAVVGILERGQRREITWGRQNAEGSPNVEQKTLFEIGSLTKNFTALLLAHAVHRHDVEYDDSVDQ